MVFSVGSSHWLTGHSPIAPNGLKNGQLLAVIIIGFSLPSLALDCLKYKIG